VDAPKKEENSKSEYRISKRGQSKGKTKTKPIRFTQNAKEPRAQKKKTTGRAAGSFSSFEFWKFEFVSYFDIRILNFRFRDFTPNHLSSQRSLPRMNKPEHHIFVCAGFRVGSDAKGVCHKKESTDLLQHIENEILDRGLDALVSTTGCMKMCDRGPVVIIYPEGHWYGQVDKEKADAILDALEEGQAAEELLLT
jgi:(2Fe-2S) ferredoxin